MGKDLSISSLMNKMSFAEFQIYLDGLSENQIRLILASAWGYIEGMEWEPFTKKGGSK